jgi:hypothetical protein
MQRNQSSLRTFLRKVSSIPYHCQRLVKQPTRTPVTAAKGVFIQPTIAPVASVKVCPSNKPELAQALPKCVQPTRTPVTTA